MAVQTAQEKKVAFLKPDYYPPCLPECIRYNQRYQGGILFKQEILALVRSWHLNEAFSLVAEALHCYPERQRILFWDALGAVARERSYFAGLCGAMEKAVGSGYVFMVEARGQRLTPSGLKGCDFLDRQYAEAAAGWKKRGDVVCFLTYPSLVYLPRVLDAYRDSERPILLDLPMAGQPNRCYHMIPANWSSKISLSVVPLSEAEYSNRGELLMEAGESLVSVPE